MEQDKFREGVCYALEYLSELFEGVQETDLWTEFKGEQEVA